VHWCIGALVQRCRGAENQGCKDGELERWKGFLVLRSRGGEVQRCRGGEVERWRGA